MTFLVTYRDKTGAKREEALEAANRTECLAACRARGISPLAILEGSKRFKGDRGAKGVNLLKGTNGDGHRSRRNFPFYILHFTFAIAAVAAIALVWWWFGSNESAPQVSPTAVLQGVRKEIPASPPSSHHYIPGPRGNGHTSVTGSTVSAVPVTTESSTNEVAMPVAKALPPPPTNRTFKTTTEQVLGHVFTTRLGDMPFPVPRIPEEELAKIKEILERDVPLKDSDDVHVLDTKETVAAAKKEFAAFLSGGGKPEEFLPYYHEVLRKAFEEYSMACDACEKVREEHPEIYKEFLATVNQRLAAKGIRQVVPEPDGEEGTAEVKAESTTKEAP